jgi:hypothetical protein
MFSHKAVNVSAKLLNSYACFRVVDQAYEACVPAHAVGVNVFVPNPHLRVVFKLERCDQHHRPHDNFIYGHFGEVVDMRIS